MFKADSQKNTFLEQTKAAREGRAFEKKKEVAVTKLQAAVRGWLQRIHFRRDVLKLVAEDIPEDLNDANSKSAINIYFTVNRFLLVWKKNEDRELFEKLCRYLVASVESESLKLSYISVALNKEYSLNWIKQVKEILYKCCEYLDQLKPEVSVDMKSILLFLHTLVTFTSTNTWKILQSKSLQQLQPGMNQLSANIMGHLFMKGFYLTLNSLLVRGLARQKVALKNISLSAIITLALRPLVSASFSDKLMCMFILHIMRVPALFVHLHDYARESITSIKNHKLLERCLNFLAAERDGSVVFDSGSHTVCLVANLIHLAHIFQSSSLQEIDKLQFAEVLRRLMSKGMKTSTKDSKLSRWHPLLGWMSDSSSDALLLEEESVSNVKHQLCLLWCQPLIHYFLVSTIIENSTQPSSPTPQTSQSQNFFKRALDGRIGSKQPKTKIGTADCPLTPVSKVFNMYHTCLYTLTPLRLDILTGLCYQDNMLYLMWKFIEGLGLSNVLKGFLDLLSPSPDRIYSVPEFNTLILFCECMIHYITLLDDIEMYEEQEPFKLTDFSALSSFLNMFIYKGFLNNLFEGNGRKEDKRKRRETFTALKNNEMAIPREEPKSQQEMEKDSIRLKMKLRKSLKPATLNFEESTSSSEKVSSVVKGFSESVSELSSEEKINAILQGINNITAKQLLILQNIGNIKADLSQIISKVKAGCGSKLCDVLHSLLMILYRRDSRRPYCPKNHWLIKDIKISNFISDLEKGKRPTRLMLGMVPHVIQHTERVQLFRKFVTDDKTDLGLIDPSFSESFRLPLNPNNIHSTLITIHRRRIVEDGYRQLALLSPQSLKGVIRVRFINEQGLDEAGIDQDGVFKEFLEETIKRVFDPGLNLFRVTSEERLYPSATSHLQENHLHLFEFVGRMLAKAVYEGIVVDVPFAPFFLSQVLGQPQEAPYSCIDELPSLDNELYKSLTFIKHYKGDVQDLSLTFSVDTEILGQLVTHELIPGGKAVPVTNQNKINYIYLMAHFRMHTQIKDQMAAFIRGFRSIISQEWLLLFSPPERLISGDNVPLDIADLRRHTQYYGGFHDSHRVVLWLWDILLKDFTEEERRLFLKFVTSCSKPPLLGFAHLEPSFSIRCVEVGDDEDQGDTIGSVIRGFFTIRKKDPQNRLPTSSTCFNLLKLPNYQRKSILREKLRYAITSNTGFELS